MVELLQREKLSPAPAPNLVALLWSVDRMLHNMDTIQLVDLTGGSVRTIQWVPLRAARFCGAVLPDLEQRRCRECPQAMTL